MKEIATNAVNKAAWRFKTNIRADSGLQATVKADPMKTQAESGKLPGMDPSMLKL